MVFATRSIHPSTFGVSLKSYKLAYLEPYWPLKRMQNMQAIVPVSFQSYAMTANEWEKNR